MTYLIFTNRTEWRSWRGLKIIFYAALNFSAVNLFQKYWYNMQCFYSCSANRRWMEYNIHLSIGRSLMSQKDLTAQKSSLDFVFKFIVLLINFWSYVLCVIKSLVFFVLPILDNPDVQNTDNRSIQSLHYRCEYIIVFIDTRWCEKDVVKLGPLNRLFILSVSLWPTEINIKSPRLIK